MTIPPEENPGKAPGETIHLLRSFIRWDWQRIACPGKETDEAETEANVTGREACHCRRRLLVPFLATQIWNNHTETVLLTTLLGQYLRFLFNQLLHFKLTHFYYFIFYHEACGLLVRFCLLRQLHGVSLSSAYSLLLYLFGIPTLLYSALQ